MTFSFHVLRLCEELLLHSYLPLCRKQEIYFKCEIKLINISTFQACYLLSLLIVGTCYKCLSVGNSIQTTNALTRDIDDDGNIVVSYALIVEWFQHFHARLVPQLCYRFPKLFYFHLQHVALFQLMWNELDCEFEKAKVHR